MKRVIIYMLCITSSFIMSGQDDFVNQLFNAYDECQKKSTELNDNLATIEKDYKVQLSEVNQGHICSECSRPKSVIERDENESFQSHLTRVRGYAIKPTQKQIMDARTKLSNKYKSQKTRAENQIVEQQNSCDERISAIEEEQMRVADQQLLETHLALNDMIRGSVLGGYQDSYDYVQSIGDELYGMEVGGSDLDIDDLDNDEFSELIDDLEIDHSIVVEEDYALFDDDHTSNKYSLSSLEPETDETTYYEEEESSVISTVGDNLSGFANALSDYKHGFIEKVNSGITTITDYAQDQAFEFGLGKIGFHPLTANRMVAVGNLHNPLDNLVNGTFNKLSAAMTDFADFGSPSSFDFDEIENHVKDNFVAVGDAVVGLPFFSIFRQSSKEDTGSEEF